MNTTIRRIIFEGISIAIWGIMIFAMVMGLFDLDTRIDGLQKQIDIIIQYQTRDANEQLRLYQKETNE